MFAGATYPVRLKDLDLLWLLEPIIHGKFKIDIKGDKVIGKYHSHLAIASFTVKYVSLDQSIISSGAPLSHSV
jgi:hypothetical protein